MKFLPAVVLFLLLSGCIYAPVNVDLIPPMQEIEEHVVGGKGNAKVVVVDVSGVLNLRPVGPGRFSREPPLIPRLREELEKAAGDPKVVALVVRIDSPGGSVTASDILYHEIDTFRREKKVPVIVCVMDKALSGGYYAAMAADGILAHPTSVVGGVGVISWHVNIGPLLQKWGMEAEVVKAGELKDFWSPLRRPEEGEAQIMQELIDSLRARFVNLVQERRQLSSEAMRRVGTARVFGAGEALDLGMIDRLGYLEDAVKWSMELADVSEALTVIYRRPGSYARNIYAAIPPMMPEMAILEDAASELLAPTFRYQLPFTSTLGAQ